MVRGSKGYGGLDGNGGGSNMGDRSSGNMSDGSGNMSDGSGNMSDGSGGYHRRRVSQTDAPGFNGSEKGKSDYLQTN